jgi:hypothetical protein
MPGLSVQVLSMCCSRFTGEQQEHIAKIILYDYLEVFTYSLKLFLHSK